jgi:2,4-dienoyl-CoA reductase-like NADH-dependent reductase (Old Yellow Enzyme family)
MTERISTFVEGSPEKSGLPVRKLINLYEKWSHGGFGMILTGNIPVDFNHLEAAGNVFIDSRFDSEERRQKIAKLASSMKSGGNGLAVAQLTHVSRVEFIPKLYSRPGVKLHTFLIPTHIPLQMSNFKLNGVEWDLASQEL